ncbi:MAG: alpha-glucosidase C-terminal domain-containing protein [Clostridia bacterium]|nr:alpha-glucosidase C-terminal domain-containing protein [Clostridia bacterium]
MNNKEKKIIYQLALRTFTPAGTLRAATQRLAHVAALGVDIVYICPFYVTENDENREFWSKRQLASMTNNPKNPYKIADYFHVDEEYGTDEDLKAFVEEAHRQGLGVMFDLVYLHCGRQAVFIEEHPDFVERNEDGSLKVPERWPFARLNFESRALREYLFENMEMFVREYGIQGFRCDVGDSVPLDFWQEAFERLRAIDPELIMLNEGVKAGYLGHVFDWGYSFDYRSTMVKIFAREQPATMLRELYDRECEQYGQNIVNLTRALDNHDTASDCGLDRNEIIMTSRGVEAALVVTNTYLGIPFFWNGYEVCDAAENNMFSNRFYGRRSQLDWSGAFTENGVRRLPLVKKLHALHHGYDAITNGELIWVEHDRPEEVISYIRCAGDQKLLVLVNSKNRDVSVKLDLAGRTNEVLLRYGAKTEDDTVFELKPYGYLVVRYS